MSLLSWWKIAVWTVVLCLSFSFLPVWVSVPLLCLFCYTFGVLKGAGDILNHYDQSGRFDQN